jgi:hypothetical protein
MNDKTRTVLHNFVQDLAPERWRILEGEPLASLYPKDAFVQMTDRDGGPRLGSLVGNTRRMFIVSTAFRRLIEDACVGVPIEYLPLSIRDPRKRVLSGDYHLINPLGTFDCLDYKKSAVTVDPDDPDDVEVDDIEEVVLDRRKMREAPEMFRIKGASSTYVVGYELAKKMTAAELTNIMWAKLAINDS